jgi:hypothetical protein
MRAYAIRGGEEGKERLNLLAQVMLPTTSQFAKCGRSHQRNEGCKSGFRQTWQWLGEGSSVARGTATGDEVSTLG